MTEPSGIGSYGNQPDTCSLCGVIPPIKRNIGDGEFSPPICRTCLWNIADAWTKRTRELSPLPDDVDEEVHVPTEPSAEDDEAAWTRFDCASRAHGVLNRIANMIERDSSGIRWVYSWNGGPADEPPAQMNEVIERVRAFLERNGYDVSVETGVDRELAKHGTVSRFHAAYAVDRPRWTSTVSFQKSG